MGHDGLTTVSHTSCLVPDARKITDRARSVIHKSVTDHRADMGHDGVMGFRTRLDIALAELNGDPKDDAVRALAEAYADAMDADPTTVDPLGPKFLRALAELQLTPRARAAALKGGLDDDGVPARSDELARVRRQRRVRLAGPPPLDTTAP